MDRKACTVHKGSVLPIDCRQLPEQWRARAAPYKTITMDKVDMA